MPQRERERAEGDFVRGIFLVTLNMIRFKTAPTVKRCAFLYFAKIVIKIKYNYIRRLKYLRKDTRTDILWKENKYLVVLLLRRPLRELLYRLYR